ncbi:hypothetical protein NP493_2996g00015 [Ridgeia piscesae]|uniref:Uncharacterized protein n=1 Tax=Ridgeia piscesae TaxID=27915 RepID=A0AAD9MXF3_RIDPI|nr:hypothetical protein NP493_2996g00015 [Ridgeia piscesae]
MLGSQSLKAVVCNTIPIPSPHTICSDFPVNVVVINDALRTQPLATIPDGQQPAVATSAPSQPATRDGTYQGLYQTIPEVRQNDGAYEMIPPAEGTQGDRSEMPYANTRQYENTRRA